MRPARSAPGPPGRRASVVWVGRYATSRSEPRFSPCCNSVAPSHEDHLHLHRRGARARDARRCCRSSRRSPRAAGVEVELRDISLAGRILAQFPDRSTTEQRVPDALAELGELARTPEANIIKLPNISASVPQLKAAIDELQEQGYDDPRLPGGPADDDEREVRAPLRQGQGQRGQPGAARGQLRPPRARLGQGSTRASTRTRWARGRRTRESHVATMSDGDFRSTERSVTVDGAGDGAHRARRRRRRRHGAQGAHRRCWRAR